MQWDAEKYANAIVKYRGNDNVWKMVNWGEETYAEYYVRIIQFFIDHCEKYCGIPLPNMIGNVGIGTQSICDIIGKNSALLAPNIIPANEKEDFIWSPKESETINERTKQPNTYSQLRKYERTIRIIEFEEAILKFCTSRCEDPIAGSWFNKFPNILIIMYTLRGYVVPNHVRNHVGMYSAINIAFGYHDCYHRFFDDATKRPPDNLFVDSVLSQKILEIYPQMDLLNWIGCIQMVNDFNNLNAGVGKDAEFKIVQHLGTSSYDGIYSTHEPLILLHYSSNMYNDTYKDIEPDMYLQNIGKVYTSTSCRFIYDEAAQHIFVLHIVSNTKCDAGRLPYFAELTYFAHDEETLTSGILPMIVLSGVLYWRVDRVLVVGDKKLIFCSNESSKVIESLTKSSVSSGANEIQS